MRKALVMALCFAVLPQIAAACDCPALPPDQVVRASTMFFAGETMIPQEVVPEGGASFQHSLIWKGPQVVNPIVAPNRPGGDASCAVPFYLSRTYVVPAFGTYETGYYTDSCMLSRVNGAGPSQQKVMSHLAVYYLRLQTQLQDIGPVELTNLVWLRKVAALFLKEYSSEQARRFYRLAADVSRNSVVDLQGEGEAYLQLLMGQQALTRFDDVLEKDNKRQAAWSGRYKALALMDRWNELPQEKADLTGFIWRYGTLTSDLKSPILAKAWWMQVVADNRKLAGADFNHAELSAVSFKNTDLAGADFSNAKLYNIDFTGANLKDAKLTDITYEYVKWPDGFTPPPSKAVQQPVIPGGAQEGQGSVGQKDATGR